MIRVRSLIFLAFCLTAPFWRSQAQELKIAVEPNRATGPGVLVEVQSVIPYGTPKNALYEISYSYKFDGRETVYISEGAHLVPAAGKFTYLTRDLKLQFLDSTNGASLLVIPLKVTFVPSGTISDTLPNEADFLTDDAQGYRTEGYWPGRAIEFRVHINDVLQSFHLKYRFCFTEENCVVTERKSLAIPGAKHGEQGDVAVKIAYTEEAAALPAQDITTNQTGRSKKQQNTNGDKSKSDVKLQSHFRIYSNVREKLSHDAWGKPEHEVADAANEFVHLLLIQLQAKNAQK